MLTAGDFRKGKVFVMDDKVYTIVDFQHVKPGKGSAFVRAKIKNVITGQSIERTFNPTDKFEETSIERKDMQYSYKDGELYYFMDMESYELLPLNKEQVEDAMQFLKEEMMATIQFHKGVAFSVVPPNFVDLEIVFCEPGLQGDTSKAGNKPATLETGYQIQVPLFISQGEKIRVDTRDGTYMERVK